MPHDDSAKRLKGAALAGLFAALLVAGSLGPARAADDDEWIDQKFFRGLLTGLGLKRGDIGNSEIEYRERSPLVVPPSRDLPPPETTATVNDPAWPVDQDLVRRKQAAEKRKRSGDAASTWEEMGRALRPDELNKPGAVDKEGQKRSASSPEEAGNPVKPSELGYTGGLFSFGSFFGGSKAEVGRFDSEPTRSALTDPPAGYRTPAPTQPYGIGVRTAEPAKPMDPYERQNASTGNEK